MIRFTAFLFVVAVGLTANIHGSPLGKLGTDRFARRHPSLNIVGGKNASIKDFPYIASIMFNDVFMGSGAILNKRWIVTTAFNVDGLPTDGLALRVGSDSYSEGGQVLQVSKAVVPDEYTEWDWDVAVLQTSKPIQFGKKVKAIKLANKPLKEGAKGKIAGWGSTDESSYEPAPTLQQTTLTVSDRTACSQVYGFYLTDRLFCTYDNTTGPVYDDYGDPLVVNGQLHGLYAGGYFDVAGDPVLFTDVAKVRKWIKQSIKT